MGFNVPQEGDILSETEMTEFFAWRHNCALHGHTLPPEIERLVPTIGARTSDGTVYAGISPDTGKVMFTTPEDMPSVLTMKEALHYASGLLDAKGRKGFTLPSPDELSVLRNN